MIDTQNFVEDCRSIRARSPLIHNITNYVAMNIAANSLLAIGASPLMSFYDKEIEEIVGISSALMINIGCLDDTQICAMHKAAACAHRLGKPWVLDPVGVGASSVRTNTAIELIYKYKPSIIRANASEVLCLLGEQIDSHGVDSTNKSTDATDAAQALAQKTGAVVSMSGATDFICDSKIIQSLSNGSPLMPQVTAMGCTASSITAAFAAVDPSPFRAALNAMALMGIAGQIAEENCSGTASFAINFVDTLSTLDPSQGAQIIRP